MTTLKHARTLSTRTAVVARLVPSDALDAAGVDAALLKRLSFKGEAGQSATVTSEGTVIRLVGLGASGEVNPTAIRKATANAVRELSGHASVAVDLGVLATSASLDLEAVVQAAGEGAALGAYRFTEYKAASDTPYVATVTLVAPGGKAGLTRAIAISDSVNWARDLVNEPGGTLTPTVFAQRVKERASAAGLKVEVLTAKQIAAKGLGGLLAVNRGSVEEPRFVKLTYNPATAAARKRPSVGLVGKGITFDSGGLSIKPVAGMMTMKCDMAGAAAVVATMVALPALGVGVPVTSYTPLTDNMPGPDATRPGDIYRAHNGTTVEVLNTDAEGRLVLGDALSIASDDGHRTIIDLATLTGACMVALGDQIAGLMGTDDELIEALKTAAERAGEKVWHLPLPAEYRKLIDSPIADIKNIGGQYGGTLTAGLFLKEFVGDDIAWAHLDIAGPAFTEAASDEVARGGTGFGVRTLIELLETRAR
ncbi:MAG: leucyl aminopeptidase [Microthrixaceae bacterium]|nr:leucyl aminopeptidase [Microthrixaceae bacterium]